MRPCMIAASCVLVLVLASRAFAQPDEEVLPPQAQALFEEARTLDQKGEHEAACERFARAFAIIEGAGIEANLAACAERRGDLPLAWRLFQSAATRWDSLGKAKQSQFARDRAAAIAQRLATVEIRVRDPEAEGLAIALNGNRLAPAAKIREVLAAGDIEVSASQPGKAPFERSRRVAAGETAVIEISFRSPPPAPPIVDDTRRRTRVRWSIGLGATAGVALATSLGLALYALDRYDEVASSSQCDGGDPPRCTEEGQRSIASAQTIAHAGTGTAIAGGALAVIAVFVYLTAPPAADARAGVAPIVDRDGAGAMVWLRF